MRDKWKYCVVLFYFDARERILWYDLLPLAVQVPSSAPVKRT
nr:MAG TPA: hypothetical protein [Caudoviricetes sp.]